MTIPVDALTDRLVIDTADITDAHPEWYECVELTDDMRQLAALAAQDRAAVTDRWLTIATQPRALARLEAWGRRGWDRFGTHLGTLDGKRFSSAFAIPGPPAERLWAVAELLVGAARIEFQGLSPVLTAASPVGTNAWTSDVEVARPQRFALASTYEGSQMCLWSAFGPDQARWTDWIGPEELPLPQNLTTKYLDLAALNDELNIDGWFPEEHRTESARIWRESQELLRQWQQLLGPAYVVKFSDGGWGRH